MNPFVAALNSVLPHFRVRDSTLVLSQGHPLTLFEIDLRRLAAHRMVSVSRLQLRLFRGRWKEYSLDGFRPSEVKRLMTVLTRWERSNRQLRNGAT